MSSKPLHEEHGGIDPVELNKYGLSVASLIDFSVNSNPFGPSPHIFNELRQVDISRYPDRNCSELTNRLAYLNHVSETQLLIGNGTAELIWLIAHAFIKPGDQVLIVGPTFSEYKKACERLHASTKEINAAPPEFMPPLDKAFEYIREVHPRMVFLCNPNNPTGKSIAKDKVQKLINLCSEKTILVVDKAYSAFYNGSFFETDLELNTLVLRSMTKDFALAGLRLGYLLGSADQIEQIKSCQPSWSVNAYAQSAGLAALSDLDYYQNTLLFLQEIQRSFFEGIRSVGYHLVNSDVHFALVKSYDSAYQMHTRLLKSRLQVRDCNSFGLPEYIRVSTRMRAENEKLVSALKQIKASSAQ